jgi:hypothetical protein
VVRASRGCSPRHLYASHPHVRAAAVESRPRTSQNPQRSVATQFASSSAKRGPNVAALAQERPAQRPDRQAFLYKGFRRAKQSVEWVTQYSQILLNIQGASRMQGVGPGISLVWSSRPLSTNFNGNRNRVEIVQHPNVHPCEPPPTLSTRAQSPCIAALHWTSSSKASRAQNARSPVSVDGQVAGSSEET